MALPAAMIVGAVVAASDRGPAYAAGRVVGTLLFLAIVVLFIVRVVRRGPARASGGRRAANPSTGAPASGPVWDGDRWKQWDGQRWWAWDGTGWEVSDPPRSPGRSDAAGDPPPPPPPSA